MRVAALQFKPVKGDRVESERRLLALLERLQPPIDLVVLPELALTGYLFSSRDQILPLTEPSDGPTAQLLAPVARRLGAFVVCGFPEREGQTLYNSALVVGPDGAVDSVVRKTLLYSADVPWASPGDQPYRVIPTPAGTFAVGICMDLNDDRFIDWLTGAQPDVLAFPTNWVDEGHDIWTYWAMQLWETRISLVAADTYGTETLDGVTTGFWGRSAIIEAAGQPGGPMTLLRAAPAEGDAVLVAQLELPRARQEGLLA